MRDNLGAQTHAELRAGSETHTTCEKHLTFGIRVQSELRSGGQWLGLEA